MMTATQARRLLRVSKPKMAQLIREGVLPVASSPLDKRVKLVRAVDVEALLHHWRRPSVGGESIRADQAATSDASDAPDAC